MKLLRTTALTAVLMTAAVPLLTSQAQAWRWRGAGLGWRGAAVGAAVVGSAIAARNYYGYGTGYSYPAYGYGPQSAPPPSARSSNIPGGAKRLASIRLPIFESGPSAPTAPPH